MTEVIFHKNLKQVLNNYDCDENECRISRLGNGLINDTYLIHHAKNNFVLQKINHHVFTQPEQVVNNANLINAHLIAQQASKQYGLKSIWQLPATNGKTCIEVNGETWRALHFIPHCYTLESVENPQQANQVARAFAQFTSALSNFSTASLSVIIPDFHNISFRMQQLELAVSNNSAERYSSCIEQVKFCQQQRTFVDEVSKITKKLPLRVTHNDTKINNLLFSRATDEPIAVIDLDTCMPGYLMHDFGDMVRTCCSTIEEDSTDLVNMSIKTEVLTALYEGYISTLADTITPIEKQSLLIGAKQLPFMIGVRFLTDYINGDQYFHTNYPNHNLDRAKNQFHLYTLLANEVLDNELLT